MRHHFLHRGFAWRTVAIAGALLLATLLTPAPAGAATETATGYRACAAALQKPGKATSDAAPDMFRVLSWNVMKLRGRGVDEQLSRRLAQADIALLQEALSSAANRREGPGWRYFSPGYRQGGIQTGVEVLSRYEADLHCSLRFQEPWLRTPKAVDVVRIPFAPQPLLVINLHAINFTLGSSEYRQQLTDIGALVDLHEGPALVGGDFNHWNSWRVSVLRDFARDHQLLEAEFYPDWRSRHLGRPVDSFFLRGLQVVSSAVAPTDTSDHHPVMITLKMSPTADSPAAGDVPAPAR